MINNLEIENGVLNNKFDNDNYIYEVSVEEDVETLTFNLEKDEDVSVTIYGNDELTCGEGHVYLETLSNNNVTTYIFVVNKECSSPIMNYSVVEDTSYVMEKNIRIPLISIVCFMLIVICFCIIFRKK